MSSSTAEWVKPSTRPPVIEELVSGVDRYNPANVGILEDYLYHQIRTEEYDCLANLAILKLYQFNPELYNGDVAVNILTKALIATPMPDFNLCLALLAERRHFSLANPGSEESDPLDDLLPQLMTLSSLLEECRFPDFWKTYQSDEYDNLRDNYTVECKGFDRCVRDVVARAVRATFTEIGKHRLGSYVDLEGEDLVDFVVSMGWTLDGGIVTIPPNPDNTIESVKIEENIQLPQLVKIIAHAA